MRLVLLLSAVLLLGTEVSAQARGGTPPGQPGGRGGRGRAIGVMTLTSPAIPDGGAIPAKHAQNGEELSPPLKWSGAPDGTASFVLVVHDLDAPIAGGADDVLHWLVWNIPGMANSLAEGLRHGAELPDGTRQISASGPYYRGPAAPANGPPHHYVFELYALDTPIEVPAIGASPAATRAAVMAAMTGHVRAKGVLVGRFRRPTTS